jgi:hypothetical protein
MPSGSKPISGFNDGSPPQAADEYVFERANVTYKVPFSAIQNAIIAAIGTVSSSGGAVPVLEGQIFDEVTIVPGPKGDTGDRGNDGITSIQATVVMLESEHPEDPFPFPGAKGDSGAAGTNGIAGRDGAIIFIEPESPEEMMPIPGPKGDVGSQGPAGTQSVTTTMFLAESEIAEVDIVPGPKGDKGDSGGGGGSDPFEGSYDPGTFDVADGDYVMMGFDCIISGTNEVTLNGNSTLVVL